MQFPSEINSLGIKFWVLITYVREKKMQLLLKFLRASKIACFQIDYKSSLKFLENRIHKIKIAINFPKCS